MQSILQTNRRKRVAALVEHIELAADYVAAARFVAALYASASGQPGVFRRIDECTFRARITRLSQLKRAVATAEAAGYVIVHAEGQLVMLTERGRAAEAHCPFPPEQHQGEDRTPLYGRLFKCAGHAAGARSR
jgi:hypothetical protein